MARYEICITEITEEVGTIGPRWERGAGEGGEYGYTPEIQATRQVTREIYTQNTNALDLAAVIRAVNGL